jgi:hypothetical protein
MIEVYVDPSDWWGWRGRRRDRDAENKSGRVWYIPTSRYLTAALADFRVRQKYIDTD